MLKPQKTHTRLPNIVNDFCVSTPFFFLRSFVIKVLHIPYKPSSESWAILSSHAQPFKTPSLSAFFFSLLAAFASGVESFNQKHDPWMACMAARSWKNDLSTKKPSRKWDACKIWTPALKTHRKCSNIAHCHPFLSFPASHEPSPTFNCKAPWNRCGLRGVRMSLLANQTPDLINIAGKQSCRRTCCEGIVLLTSGDTNDVIHPPWWCIHLYTCIPFLLQTSWHPHSFWTFLKLPVHVLMSIPWASFNFHAFIVTKYKPSQKLGSCTTSKSI